MPVHVRLDDRLEFTQQVEVLRIRHNASQLSVSVGFSKYMFLCR
jgi:hypothetical protein